MERIDINELTPEGYQACEIPVLTIKQMIKDGTWKGSLEEEEVLYDLENNLYSEEYAKEVKKLLGEQ